MAFMPDAPPTLGAAADGALYKTNDVSAWSKSMGGVGAVGPIVTPNAGIAPDGTQTACRVQFNMGNGAVSNYSQLAIEPYLGTPGQSYTLSIYYKLFSATPGTFLLRSPIAGVTETDQLLVPTQKWQRGKIVSPPLVSTPASVAGRLTFGLIAWNNPSIPAVSTPTADVLVWGARVDLGAVALGEDLTAGLSSGTISPLALVALGVGGLLLFGRPR